MSPVPRGSNKKLHDKERMRRVGSPRRFPEGLESDILALTPENPSIN